MRWTLAMLVLGLTACAPQGAPSAPPPAASTSSLVTPDARSCTEEIGAAAAQRLVQRCIMISPATHPPCNALNSCALIQSEIDRNCPANDPAPSAACRPD